MGKRVRVFCVCIGLLSGPVHADDDDDGERGALERLIHEMEALEPLIAEAEAKANPAARVRFHYNWLRSDLRIVKSGIREHIEAPRTEPREVPPLQGDYRR